MKGACLIGAVLAVGCGSEPFYDTAPPLWRFLLATDAPAIQLRQEPGNLLVVPDLYTRANGFPLPAPAQSMELFYGTLYLLLPTATLELLEEGSYRRRAALQLPAPADGIVFPNATTAYLWHRSRGMLSMVDLLDPERIQTFQLGGRIGAALAREALLYVVDEERSLLRVFDTRTLRLQDSLPLPPHPRWLAAHPSAEELLVASFGSGDDTTAPARAPRLSFVGLRPLRLLKSIPLNVPGIDSARLQLRGLATTPSDFAYVGTSAGLLRVDLRSRGALRLLQSWNIGWLRYVPTRGELWVLTASNPPQLLIATGDRAELRLETTLPAGTVALLPLP